jgi:outer membrane protein assembly factor BamB
MILMRQKFACLLIAGWLAALAPAADSPDGWPRWRGPNDDGMARGDAPLQWSDKDRIAWKAPIPGRGNSSPVVWGDRIFVTTAVPTGKAVAGPQPEHRFMVLAYERKTGKLLWEKTARVATPHEGYHAQYGSFASNSPVADKSHVIAFFGSRGVYCYTHDGQLVWEKDFGIQLRMHMSFGEGTWPALDGNTLVLLFDHDGDSFIVALDKSTGREIWRTPRPPGSSWAGPLITSAGGRKQVIVSSTKLVAGYDLENGKLIWQATGLGENTIPAPVVADGIAVVMSGYQQPNLLAIRLGRGGNLTGTDAILWQNQRGNSYTPSPVLHEGKLYMLTDSGTLSCLDLKTGKPFYQQARLPKTYSFKSSPVGANGKLYMAAENGDVIVARMGEKFEVLATNTLADQMFIATPAILDGEIYLRGRNTLFCIR